MSVSAAASRKSHTPELQFFFRNVGEEDVVLNLGTMLANGKVQAPDRIILNIIDANGKARSFHFSGGRYGAIAGRVDDYVVPLRSGSIYGLKIGLDKFYSPSINDFWPKLSPGRYRITARFEGVGAQSLNPDTIGIGLLELTHFVSRPTVEGLLTSIRLVSVIGEGAGLGLGIGTCANPAPQANKLNSSVPQILCGLRLVNALVTKLSRECA